MLSHSSRRRLLLPAASALRLAVFAALIAGCARPGAADCGTNEYGGVTEGDKFRGAPTEDPPFVGIRNMYHQPRFGTQAANDFFADGRTMREPVAHTLPREAPVDPIVATGWDEAAQSWALTTPQAVISGHGGMGQMLERGQGRFGIFCAPCHGLNGAGDGMVARRGGGPIVPPTFHSDTIRHLPDGQLFATITNGVRNMPAYRHNIPPEDRWAIVAYVRALQLNGLEEGNR